MIDNTNREIYIDKTKMQRFDTAFSVISHEAHITIIAEGAPMNAALSVKALEGVAKGFLSNQAHTAAEIVSATANAFDYDAEELPAHVFILRKKYSDPNDLPLVTCREVIRALESMSKALTFVDSGREQNITRNIATTLFAQSLTANQIEQLKSGLPMTQLSPDQRVLIMDSIKEIPVAVSDDTIRTTLKHLKLLSNPRTTFTWFKLRDKETFGYSGPFGPTGQTWRIPLSNGYTSSVTGSVMADLAINGKRIDEHDETVPLPEDIRLGTKPDKLPCMHTLQESVQQSLELHPLKADAYSEAHSLTETVTVDDDIATKPISTFGLEYTDELSFLNAVTSMYGLSLFHRTPQTFFLTVPAPHTIENIVDFNREILRLTPLPLVRAYRAQRNAIANREAETAQKLPKGLPVPQVPLDSGSSAYYFPTVRRLRVLVQPLIPTPESPPVPIASMSDNVRDLIALIMTSRNTIGSIGNLSRLRLPSLLSDPSAIVVKGGVSDSKDSIIFNYGTTDSTGRFHATCGTGCAWPVATQ